MRRRTIYVPIGWKLGGAGIFQVQQMPTYATPNDCDLQKGCVLRGCDLHKENGPPLLLLIFKFVEGGGELLTTQGG